ncbi:hypothetical protein DFH07DRAFT_922056 [Mycena maculata]|uniref:DUF7330 domain-containing protein n=1 Tax=Mycena maculata TaxID=230809 RepID=A0AAD7IVR3_9AGAR|nr:hypothetical protein DFH07DRAFT_922056 [Mycena maculata]
MILKDAEALANSVSGPDDPPPAYANFPPSSPSPSPSQLARGVPSPEPPAALKPTNFLSLSRSNASIQGTYVIDPRINIPPFLQPPLAPDETEATRRNVFVETSFGGHIDVELFVVGGEAVDSEHRQRVEMLLKSSNAGITAKLHAPGSRPSIRLTAHSYYGHITLAIPRSFRGPVTVTTRFGSLKFAGDLAGAVTTLGEADGTHRCFVGELGDDWADAADGWAGDEIRVEATHRGVRLLYDTDAGAGGHDNGWGKGLFGKLLGL